MCAIVWNSGEKAVLISTTDAAGDVNFWSQPQGESTWPAPQLVGAKRKTYARTEFFSV